MRCRGGPKIERVHAVGPQQRPSLAKSKPQDTGLPVFEDVWGERVVNCDPPSSQHPHQCREVCCNVYVYPRWSGTESWVRPIAGASSFRSDVDPAAEIVWRAEAFLHLLLFFANPHLIRTCHPSPDRPRVILCIFSLRFVTRTFLFSFLLCLRYSVLVVTCLARIYIIYFLHSHFFSHSFIPLRQKETPWAQASKVISSATLDSSQPFNSIHFSNPRFNLASNATFTECYSLPVPGSQSSSN